MNDIQINAPLTLNALAIKCNDPGMPVRELDPGDNTKVYENTSGTVIAVCVTVAPQGNLQGSVFAYIATPPVEEWEWLMVGTHHVDAYGTQAHHIHGAITFFVPPGYYYKASAIAYVYLLHWFEWYLVPVRL